MFIPESLLNLQLLAYCDIALALIAIIFQVIKKSFYFRKHLSKLYINFKTSIAKNLFM